MRTPARDDIAAFVLKKVPEHPKDIVSLIAVEFTLSRPRAYEHVMKQVRAGKVIKTGRTSSSKYFLTGSNSIELIFDLNSALKEDEVWTKYFKSKLISYPENVYRICNYAFTEILNNAIDHSEGKAVICRLSIHHGKIDFQIHDDGVGIFNKIQRALNLPSIREAILHLSKGRFTTDPSRHSGQGIFFTSRLMDEFCILSNGMYYHFQNSDWLLSREKKEQPIKGTYIQMEISIDSKKITSEIMGQYADIETGFHKTVVSVQLSSDPNDPHVSRSQAKRVLVGLEKFKNIELDFDNVTAVGQAFVDEIFRVFQNEHPEISITYTNANPDVDFMIKTGLVTK